MTADAGPATDRVEVLLDGRGYARGGTGIARYVRALAAGLRDQPDAGLHIHGSWSDRRMLGDQSRGKHDRTQVSHGPDVRVLEGRGARVVTVHDLAFLQHPECYPPHVADTLHALLASQADKVDRVVCVSHTTERDLVETFPTYRGRTAVAHHGIDPQWFGVDPAAQRAPRRVRGRPYVVHLGALVPRKNLPVLVQAWLIARREIDDLALVLAGPSAKRWMSDHQKIREIVAAHPSAKRDLWIPGRVREPVARSLMAHAAVAASTTHAEGFGFPVLEAMAAGTPVVASRLPVYAEVAGDHVRFVDTSDPEAVAAQLLDATRSRNDPSEQQRLAHAKHWASRYTWLQCVETTMTAYRDAVADAPLNPITRR